MRLDYLKFLSIVFMAIFTSCSDNDSDGLDDTGSKVVLPESRVFILNEGSYDANNAGIAFYDPKGKSELIADIFQRQNGIMLGDVAQDMIEYNGYMYVSVFGSNYICKLNAAGVEVKRTLFAQYQNLQGGVRYLAADGGYIYASFYGGVIAKIDATTLDLVSTLATTGKNLEGIAIEDGVLYAANAYEIVNNNYNYLNELITVNLRSFKQGKSVTVTQNPYSVIEESDRIFVISHDYFQESYVLQMVNPSKSDEVSVIGFATNMAKGDDVLYLVDSRTDFTLIPFATVNTFFSYDIATNTLNKSSFLKNAPTELESASIYAMAVDDECGDIYIAVTSYAYGNGDIYRFRRDGSFVEKFDCGGQNPRAFAFY